MKNIKGFLLLLSMTILIVSGCGTSETKGDSTNGSPIEDTTPKEDIKDKEEEIKEDELIRLPEMNLTYSFNGVEKEETAFFRYSENQTYSMYVLPEYELAAEEPYRDVVIFKENEEIFMRIEILPTDVNWDDLKETTKLQLEAVSDDVQFVEAPADEFYHNSTVLSAKGNGDYVVSYLVQNKDLPLKLTLFMKEDADHTGPFLKMANTILSH